MEILILYLYIFYFIYTVIPTLMTEPCWSLFCGSNIEKNLNSLVQKEQTSHRVCGCPIAADGTCSPLTKCIPLLTNKPGLFKYRAVRKRTRMHRSRAILYIRNQEHLSPKYVVYHIIMLVIVISLYI